MMQLASLDCDLQARLSFAVYFRVLKPRFSDMRCTNAFLGVFLVNIFGVAKEEPAPASLAANAYNPLRSR